MVLKIEGFPRKILKTDGNNYYQKLTNFDDEDSSSTDCYCDDLITNSSKPLSKKPKSILINHDQEDGSAKKSKSQRYVSFSMDEDKRPLTSSIYYGVKSYLHHFYEPVHKLNGDNFKDDDFEFVIEPGRRRRNYWLISATLFLGVVLLLIATSLLTLNNHASQVQGVESEIEEAPVQKTATTNKKIETWRFAGLILFCAGGVVIMLTLLFSANDERFGCLSFSDQMSYPSTVETNGWIRYAEVQPHYASKIPLHEEVTAVQQQELDLANIK